MSYEVGIIGMGKMGCSLACGLSKVGLNRKVIATRPRRDFPEGLVGSLNIDLNDDAGKVVRESRAIFVCVRSDQVYNLLQQYQYLFNSRHVVLCFSAGVFYERLSELLRPSSCALVRVISNVNVAAAAGVSIIFPPSGFDSRITVGLDLLRHLGIIVEAESERELDVFSLMSGTIPAISAMFVQSIVRSGTSIGIKEKLAEELARCSVSGTLKMLVDLRIGPEAIIDLVGTPGGLVEAILDKVEKEGFGKIAESWCRLLLERLDAR